MAKVKVYGRDSNTYFYVKLTYHYPFIGILHHIISKTQHNTYK